ncbi:hypothetical protein CDL12_25931 [Handroanthus impetiginosus]|uniref:Late embryogenesis abundant protein LEA-2 subgroup domain-containing protein n=1 Tax=Handroanthus impetiginosus TaxID=429701 RepID=A0A2G9G8F2_9LAMI|nr:hypothetical protein CDL12_25931 [Handroanthus impetiginosus]
MSKGEGKRSTKKCLAYVAAFVVFQTAIILIFALTVMKVRSPKIRFNVIAVESFSSNNSTTSSINMRLLAQVDIKNTNFGHFKYNNSTLTVLYDGVPLGEVVIPQGRAKARKTRRFNVAVDLSSERLSGNGNNLGNDINSGILRLRSEGRVSGKVHLMKIIKRNKSGVMNCDWSINLGTRQVENLRCN